MPSWTRKFTFIDNVGASKFHLQTKVESLQNTLLQLEVDLNMLMEFVLCFKFEIQIEYKVGHACPFRLFTQKYHIYSLFKGCFT